MSAHECTYKIIIYHGLYEIMQKDTKDTIIKLIVFWKINHNSLLCPLKNVVFYSTVNQ